MSGNTYEVSTADGRVLTVEAEDEGQARRAAAEFVMRQPAKGGERPLPGVNSDYPTLSEAGETAESLEAKGFVRGLDGVWRKPVEAAELGVDPTPPPDSAYDPEALADARRAYGDVVPDQLAAFNQGSTFGFADEMAAELDGWGTRADNLLRSITGQEMDYTGDEAEEASRYVQRERMARFAEEHPLQDTGYRTAGAVVAPGMKGGNAFIARGGNLISRSARSGVVGGAAGGAYGLGTGEGDIIDRLPNALEGTVTGAAIGTAVPGATKAVQAVAEPIVAPIVNAAKGAYRNMRGQSGVQPADTARAEQIMREMSARSRVTPETVAQHPYVQTGRDVRAVHLLNRDAQAQLSALARRQGVTGDVVADDIYARADALPQRLMDDFAEIGPRPAGAEQSIDDVLEAGRAKARPLFDQALGNDASVTGMEGLSNRPVIRRALRDVYDDVLNAGEDPEAFGLRLVRRPNPGGGTIDEHVELVTPKAATWDKARKAVSNQVERHPMTGRPLPDSVSQGNRNVGVASRDLTAAMKRNIPGYEEALNVSGDYMSTGGAFERARGSLFGNVSVRDFGKMWGAARSESEREAFRAAIAADIYEMAQRGQLKPGKLLSPRVMGKLRLAFGSKAEEFLARAQAEQRIAGVDRRINPGGGSPTAELTDAMRVQDGVGPMGQLAQGRPWAAAASAVTGYLRSVLKRPGLSEMERDELGRLLMMEPDQLVEFLSSPAGQATVRRYGVTGAAVGALQPPRVQENQR